MEIKLDPIESEDFFHAALCNGAGEIAQYGFELDYSNEKYREAKDSLLKKQESGEFSGMMICREDIWMEILRVGGTLTLVDTENKGEYTSTISRKDVWEGVQQSPANHLFDMANDRDDAITAYVILQTVFFNDVVFG
jgi:hypothetical protein